MTSELRTKMVTAGHGTLATVFENTLPATPDAVIALDEGAGMPGVGFLGEAVGLEQPSLRVRVRGAAQDEATPRATIEAISQYLEGLGAFVATSVRYLAFTPLGSPFVLDRDSKERVVWAINFIAMKEHP